MQLLSSLGTSTLIFGDSMRPCLCTHIPCSSSEPALDDTILLVWGGGGLLSLFALMHTVKEMLQKTISTLCVSANCREGMEGLRITTVCVCVCAWTQEEEEL